MARSAVKEREKKKAKVRERCANKRGMLKEKLRVLRMDPVSNYDELQDVTKEFQALPRNASPSRGRRRCRMTGRPRGVYRKVGLSRGMFRLYAMRGEIPGLVKSSW